MRRPHKILVFVLAFFVLFAVGSALVASAPHARYAGFSATHDVSVNERSLVVTDDVMFKQAWYSINGTPWERFDLVGTAHPRNAMWLVGSAVHDGLPMALLSPGEHYLILYSCTSQGDAWDCHGSKWQLEVINNTVDVQTTPTIIAVSASDYDIDSCDGGPCSPRNTLDDVISDSSRWSACGDDAWIEYELSDVAEVSYLDVVSWPEVNDVNYFDILLSTDGVDWVAVFEGSTDGVTVDFERFSFEPTQARYVRIVGHGNTGDYSCWTSLLEVRIQDFEISLNDTVCVPEARRRCFDDDVYWYDSCDNLGVLLENCPIATPCLYGSCRSSDISGNVIFSQDFEHRSVGEYTSDEIKEDWRDTSGTRSTETIRIEEALGNKFMKNYIKAGQKSLGVSGLDWYMPLPQNLEELYVDYRMMFSENIATEYVEDPHDVDPAHWIAGKAGPGFYTRMGDWGEASTKPTPEDKSFAIMIAFSGGKTSTHDKVRLKFYVYHLDMPCAYYCGDEDPDNDQYWGDGYGIDYDFSPDVWYDVTVRFALNDPGSNNGVLQYYVDDNMVASFDNFRFREYSDVKIDSINMANFLGGSGTEPYEESWWAFDDFVVYDSG